MAYLESKSKRVKKRRWLRRLITLLFLLVAAAGIFYYQEQIMAFWQDIRRVVNKPEVEKILAETRREEYGVLCVGAEQANDCYIFDRNGVVFAKAKTVVGEVILRVEELSEVKPAVGKIFLPDSQWASALKILDFVKKGEWPPAVFRLKRERQELILDSSPKLLFSLRFDPSRHLAALTELKKKVKVEALSYIDLRVEDKIFYK